MSEGRNHWSNCALTAQFVVIDAIAAIPWFAVLLHPRWGTAGVALVVTVFLIYVQNIRKMTVLDYFRGLFVSVSGRVRSTTNIIDDMFR